MVLETISDRIVNLAYAPGSPISENDLAAQLGVSRTPVREALQLLEDARLVEIYPKKGTYVSRVDLDLVTECQFLRESIELASLRSLSFPISEAASEQIVQNLTAQKACVEQDDLPGFLRLDEQFHAALMGIGGHSYSWQVVSNAKLHLDRARYLGFQEATPIGFYCDQHQEIFDAVLAADMDQATSLLKSHLRFVFADLEKAQAALPDFFAVAKPA